MINDESRGSIATRSRYAKITTSIQLFAESVNLTIPLTFLSSLAEDGVVFVDGQQGDVVVVDDVLRVFEAVVRAQEVLDGRHQSDAELVDEQNVEDLS